MDRPMKLSGPNVYELVLAELVNGLGLLALGWGAAAVPAASTLLPTRTPASGLLVGAVGAAGLCLMLAGSDVRRRAVLDLGLWLLGAAALALVILGALEGRAAAIGVGAGLLAGRLAAGGLRRAALRAGYRPRWFSPRSFETMVAVADTMLDADGREAIPPVRAAMHTDELLADIDAPVRSLMRLLFFVLEWVLPLGIGRPLPFTALGSRSRRRLIEILIRPWRFVPKIVDSQLRTIARTLKVLTCAGYYGDPKAMRAIGFEEFEGSPRSAGVDLTPASYPPPKDHGTPRPPGRVASERFDAVVVGSGASGSVMAYELARRDLSVAIVERGRKEDPQTFEHDERAMFARLYKYGGLQTAADHNSAIFQGCTVGGSTVINNAIWLRPDVGRVLREWEERGAPIDRTRLEAAYAELERALHVSPICTNVANPGAEIFLHGCNGSNTPGKWLKNNRQRCTGCGWCNYGCRYNRKTSMLVTYIPWAIARGVEIRDQVQDARIVVERGRATGVEGTRLGERVALQAEKVVVCAGAIGSSALLLQSGINPKGNVGKNLHALGGLFVTGDMGEVVDGFAGIGLCCVAEPPGADYVLESYFAPPLAFSVRLGGWLLSHFDRAERYRHFIDGGVMVGTDPKGGSVSLTLIRKEPKIELRPSDNDIELLKEGLERMATIYFEAGAQRVYPSTFKYIDLTRATYKQVIQEQIKSVDDILFGSAHPQGGNVMNRDPAKGVVDESFKVYGVDGLYVADTSVWPSNIRANCQATAMAMSHYAAEKVHDGN